MSVIQKIRDKYARWAVIAIALALIGFILTDYISGRGSGLFSGQSTTIGKINGVSIKEREFTNKVKIQEQNEQQRGVVDETKRQQIIENIWNQEISETLLKDEYEKLGLTVSDKELTDMLYGSDPHPLARQYLSDPQTNQYDVNQVMQIVNQIKRGKDQNQKDQLNILLGAMESDRLKEKYKNLVAGSVHYPKWVIEKQNADNGLMARVSYVNIPLTVIPDSLKEVAVSDKEIEDYLKKHKKRYTLQEASRSIQYVLFNAAPSPADSAAVVNKLMTLKSEFDSSKSLSTFLTTNSEFPYYDSYLSDTAIQQTNKKDLFALPVGATFGPYVDKDHFVIAKMVDKKNLPDSVKARHILVATQQQNQQGQLVRIREDSAAKKTIDSIQLAIKSGASFDSLLAKYSDDGGSKEKGGIYDNVYTGQMVAEFNEFIFTHGVGESGVVKTEFGYHYIEILGQKGNRPAYKIAYLAKPIEISEETDRIAQGDALKFAGEVNDLKSFDAYYEKDLKPKGLQKLVATDITEHAYEIPGIGVSRKFVQDIFEADKQTIVKSDKPINSNYVVAIVTDVAKPGLISVDYAKSRESATGIIASLRNKKKVEVMKKRLGNFSSLEVVSTAMSKPVETVDSLRYAVRDNNPLSFETKVIGTIFNPANNGKLVKDPIEGNYGNVYVIRVDNITTTAVENADVSAQRRNFEMQERMKILMSAQMGQFNQQQYDPAQVLRQAATIKDYRTKFNY